MSGLPAEFPHHPEPEVESGKVKHAHKNKEVKEQKIHSGRGEAAAPALTQLSRRLAAEGQL